MRDGRRPPPHLATIVAALVFVLPSAFAHEGHDHSHGTADTLRIEPGDSTFAGIGGGSHPRELTIRATGMRFRLRASGSGVLEDGEGALYEAALYVDHTAELGDDPPSSVQAGGWAKRIELYAARDLRGGDLVGHLQRAFKGANDVPAQMRDYFFAQLEEGLGAGETLEFTWVPGLGLATRLAGHWHPVIQSRRFGDALFGLWLGDKPVSDALKTDLFRLEREATREEGATGSGTAPR